MQRDGEEVTTKKKEYRAVVERGNRNTVIVFFSGGDPIKLHPGGGVSFGDVEGAAVTVFMDDWDSFSVTQVDGFEKPIDKPLPSAAKGSE